VRGLKGECAGEQIAERIRRLPACVREERQRHLAELAESIRKRGAGGILEELRDYAALGMLLWEGVTLRGDTPEEVKTLVIALASALLESRERVTGPVYLGGGVWINRVRIGEEMRTVVSSRRMQFGLVNVENSLLLVTLSKTLVQELCYDPRAVLRVVRKLHKISRRGIDSNAKVL